MQFLGDFMFVGQTDVGQAAAWSHISFARFSVSWTFQNSLPSDSGGGWMEERFLGGGVAGAGVVVRNNRELWFRGLTGGLPPAPSLCSRRALGPVWSRQGAKWPDLPPRSDGWQPRKPLPHAFLFVGVSEVLGPAPLPFWWWRIVHVLLQPMKAACLGVQAYLGFSLFPADIGPVTLTADPAVFQRELRELYVQVGCLAPAAGALGPSSQSP